MKEQTSKSYGLTEPAPQAPAQQGLTQHALQPSRLLPQHHQTCRQDTQGVLPPRDLLPHCPGSGKCR